VASDHLLDLAIVFRMILSLINAGYPVPCPCGQLSTISFYPAVPASVVRSARRYVRSRQAREHRSVGPMRAAPAIAASRAHRDSATERARLPSCGRFAEAADGASASGRRFTGRTSSAAR